MAIFKSKHFVYQGVYFYIAYMSNFWVNYFGLLLQSIWPCLFTHAILP
jgi:hypothetical protein